MTTNELKPVNFLVNFFDVIASPGQAFQRVSTVQVNSWWFPVLLSLATPLLHMWLTLDMQIARVREMLKLALSAMTPEQALAAQPAIERMLQPETMIRNTAIQVTGGLLISWAIALLILYFGISLSGSAIKINGLWSAIAWAWIPFALRPLAQLVWNLYTGTLITYPGLSYFVATGAPGADQRNPMYIAATYMDIFALWHLALIYILLRKVGQLGGGSSFFITLLYAAIQLGVHLIPTLIPMFMGQA